MSENVENPENSGEVLKQSNDPQVESPESESVDSSVVEKQEVAEPEGSDDNLVFTKDEYTKREAKIVAKAERRALRKIQADLEQQKSIQETAQQPSQQQSIQQGQAPLAPPGPDYVWDNLLGWVHQDTTPEQKWDMTQRAYSEAMQSSQTAYAPQPTAPPVAPAPQATDRLMDQLEDCNIEHDDFVSVMKSANLDNTQNGLSLLEQASLAKDGIKTLYESAKKNPLDLFNISKLDPEQQRYKVWELCNKKANEAVKVSELNAPPEPLDGGSGVIAKSESEMSWEELKRNFIKRL